MAKTEAQINVELLLLADYKSGKFSQRDLVEKYSFSKGKVSRLLKAKQDLKASLLYLIKISNKNIYKIGITENLKKRLSVLQTAHYEELLIVEVFYMENPQRMEKILHNLYQYREKHIRGEWFQLQIEDIQEIKRIINGNK